MTHTTQIAALLRTGAVDLRNETTLIAPADADDAALALRYAEEHALSVRLEGGNTKHAWGNAFGCEIVLSTRQMAGIREHVWQDLTATVGAGTTWSAMQKALATHGQCVALDPLFQEAATVGGIVATNDSGPLRTRYGSLRDLLLGMTVVLSDGTIARTGGKVVKNVAGYDLHKMMTGAYGTLGLITEVTFRLHPVPRSVATWTIEAADCALLDRARNALADSALPIEALQLRTLDAGFALDVKLAFLAGQRDATAERIRAVVAPLVMRENEESAWHSRQQMFVAGRATLQLLLPMTELASISHRIASVGGSAVAQQWGGLTACVPANPAEVSALRADAEACGGSLMVLAWPEGVARKPATWGTPSDALPLMREIKRRFDPHRILNRGRYLEGIDV